MSLRMSVCPSGVILFSLEHLKHLEDVLRELQGYVKEVHRVFQGSFKDDLRKFQGCLKKVPSLFQENLMKSFKDASRIFKWSFFFNFVA